MKSNIEELRFQQRQQLYILNNIMEKLDVVFESQPNAVPTDTS